MSYLFKLDGLEVTPTSECLLVMPFSAIWANDVSVDKYVAKKELAFIEFMSSVKGSNPYLGFGRDERREVLCRDLFNNRRSDILKGENRLVEEGIKWLDNMQDKMSPTYSYYLSNLEAANKLKKFFLEFDMGSVNSSGTPIYKPSDITRALNDTDKVLNNLISMRRKVEDEMLDGGKVRAGKVVNYFEQ